MSKSLGNLVFVSDLLEDRPTRARSASRSCATTTAPGSSGTTPTSTRAPRCCTGSLAAAERRDGADPRPFADARARRARRRPRRAEGARGARRPRERDPLGRRRRRPRPSVLRELGALLGIDLDRPARSRTIAQLTLRAPLVPSPTHGRLDHDHAARRLDARVRRGHHRRRHRGVDRPRLGQGRARGQGRRRLVVDLEPARSTTTPRSRSSCPRAPTAARCCATPPRT